MEKNREALKQELSSYYDRFAREYHEANYHRTTRYSPHQYRQRYIEQMIESQGLTTAAKVLDTGCGSGELTLNLLKKGYSVWAVDISRAMVDQAIKNINDNGFPGWEQIYVGDIERLAFDDGFFDVVVASGVLEYQQDDDRALHELQRVIKKEGYVIISVTNKYSPIGILSRPYMWLKRKPNVRALLSFLKERLLRRGRINPLPPSRSHSPSQFDKKLAEFEFEKIGQRYFAFAPLPSPFYSLLVSICSPVAKRMENFSGGPLGFLGGGYIVIAKNRS